ncbi:prolyl oligopeptidase family domain-containing protein [Ditylenchus destructor]|uniref:Prolyl oligopeptidase family domain-containing protein n=1 Tax=Ditylenchus destructor TaxID=166010 RepID=A0AAD4QXB1_9BILA|nr:prolyl oligopeptidase family domain-containing protein [Ditylenchus destructor]
MAPLEPNTWTESMQHARFWRNETKKSFGEPLIHLQIVTGLEAGCPSILALGSAPDDSINPQQTLMHASLPPVMPDPSLPGTLELKPLLNSPTSGSDSTKPSSELCLFYERLRGQMSSGITAYAYHSQSGKVLLSGYSQLFCYENKVLTPLATYHNNAVLNASFAPIDSNYVAFCSGGQFIIDWQNTKVYESPAVEGITNGVASFIIQEELERFEGFWWNPKHLELLYERVDETHVSQLSFTLPSQPPDSSALMRYPLPGTPNSISTLRICRINSDNTVTDLELKADLKKSARTAMLLISRNAFAEESVSVPDAEQNVGVLYEENSPFWINCNNLTYCLPAEPDGYMRFIVGSEKNNQCHLFLHSFGVTNGLPEHRETRITNGENWAVIKEATISVDSRRQLVYYLSNKLSPLLLSLCVSSYASSQECNVLTPNDLCYKFERCQPALNVNSDIGFACWVSNVQTLPECRFYHLQHPSTGSLGSDNSLPNAIFAYRITIQTLPTPHNSIAASPSHSMSNSPTSKSSPKSAAPSLYKPPSAIFKSKFFEYVSANSGKVHYAFLMWPADEKVASGNAGKFPVIHCVYAGPCIQLVRDSWNSVAQYLKFVTKGFAVLCVDGRGSANRGVEFEGTIKNSLGKCEVADQVEGLRFVAEQSNFLDLNRVGVVGWSYGGYMSFLLLAQHPELYRAACVGGAVTDWTLYDTGYTERYLGLPNGGDQEGSIYKNAGILAKVDKLPDQEGRLLIVHGMSDENVHFHHTQKLINALIAVGKPHQLLLFPSERHAIRSGSAIEYYHASMMAFFLKALS